MNNILIPTLCAFALVPSLAVAADNAPSSLSKVTITIDYSKAISRTCEAGTNDWESPEAYRFAGNRTKFVVGNMADHEARLGSRISPKYTKTSPNTAKIHLEGIETDTDIQLKFTSYYGGTATETMETGYGTTVITGMTFTIRR